MPVSVTTDVTYPVVCFHHSSPTYLISSLRHWNYCFHSPSAATAPFPTYPTSVSNHPSLTNLVRHCTSPLHWPGTATAPPLSTDLEPPLRLPSPLTWNRHCASPLHWPGTATAPPLSTDLTPPLRLPPYWPGAATATVHLSHGVLLMLGVRLGGERALLARVDGGDQRVVVDVLLGTLPINSAIRRGSLDRMQAVLWTGSRQNILWTDRDRYLFTPFGKRRNGVTFTALSAENISNIQSWNNYSSQASSRVVDTKLVTSSYKLNTYKEKCLPICWLENK